MIFLVFSSLVLSVFGQSYCTSGPTTTVDSNLGAVTLEGDNSSISDDTNCPGFIGPMDLTALTANVHQGATYRLTYTVTTCGNSFPTLAGAWIDYNQNFAFDTNELLGGVFSTSKNAVEQIFTVPAAALNGNTRMRVQVQETQATTMVACASFPYGATKDFTIRVGSIQPPPPSGPCVSGPESTADTNLGLVSLLGDFYSIYEPSNCPGKLGPQSFDQFADVTQGYSYTLQYQVTTCGNVWTSLSGAWIDWDGDGNFTNDGPLGSAFKSGQGTWNIGFRVPTSNNITLGNVTLRVQVQETYGNALEPCSTFAYGGTKDFIVTVKNQTVAYCKTGPTQTGGSALGAVTLVGANTNISNNDGCPGVTGAQDLTSQVADLAIGGGFTLTYAVLNCTTFPAQAASTAWIDFNQDFAFSPWEQIAVISQGYDTFSARFKVPISTPTEVVKTGKTRLRVQAQVNGGSDILDPCTNFAQGGTKDFAVYISGSVL